LQTVNESADEAAGRDHEPHEDHAKLDIAEKRLPQDGRIMIKYKADGRRRSWTSRVSTVPTLYGEKDRTPVAGQGKPAAGHDKLGFRTGIAEEFRTEHF